MRSTPPSCRSWISALLDQLSGSCFCSFRSHGNLGSQHSCRRWRRTADRPRSPATPPTRLDVRTSSSSAARPRRAVSTPSPARRPRSAATTSQHRTPPPTGSRATTVGPTCCDARWPSTWASARRISESRRPSPCRTLPATSTSEATTRMKPRPPRVPTSRRLACPGARSSGRSWRGSDARARTRAWSRRYRRRSPCRMRGAKPRLRGSQRRRSARAAAAVASGKGKRFASHPSTHGTRRNRRPSSRTWQHLASCGIEPPTSRMQNRRCTWNSARGEGTYRTSWWMPTGQTTWCWWSGGRTGSRPSGTFGEEGRKSAPPGTGRHPRRRLPCLR